MIKLKQEEKRYKIDTTRKVFVYKNLHKDCWSVKQDGLVKAHAAHVDLWDCAFRVNKKGRERVLAEKRKNVHAGVIGYIDVDTGDRFAGTEVTYNPYKNESFIERCSGDPVYYSSFTRLTKNGVLIE